MQEDKRSGTRRAIALDICVNNQFLNPRRWRTRDISSDSAFINMQQDEMLPGAQVEVILALANTPGAECIRLSAEIVRVAKDGVALRFQGCDSRVGEKLAHMLSDWQSQQLPRVAAGQHV